MLIILEGVDCAGKSTLANRIKEELDYTPALYEAPPDSYTTELRHSGPPALHPLDEYVTPLLDYRPGQGKHIIYDRFHWGESVYPQVFGRESQMDPAIRLYIDMFLRSRGAFIIHVGARDAVVQKCIERRGDATVTQDMVERIRRGFAACMDMSFVPFAKVNALNITYEHLHHIIRRASTEARAAMKLNNFTTYIGPSRPKLLLVGDQRHKRDVQAHDLRPAFMPFKSTSGHYLLKALLRTGTVGELANIGVANALDVDDAHLLQHALNPEFPPMAVALGSRAAKKAPWAQHQVKHPQYVRRFDHHGWAEYASDILGPLKERYGIHSQ